MAAKQHPAEELPSPDDTIEQKAERLLRLANNKLSDTAFIRSTVGWIAAYQKDVCEELLKKKKLGDGEVLNAFIEFLGTPAAEAFFNNPVIQPIVNELLHQPRFKMLFDSLPKKK